VRALFVSGTSAYPTEGDAVATAKKPAAKKPAAKKPAAKKPAAKKPAAKKPAAKKPAAKVSPVKRLKIDALQLIRDQHALNDRIKKLNKAYLKVDSSRDEKAALGLQTFSKVLRNLNHEANLFSATTQGDPFEWVLNLMKQIVAAEKKGDEDLAEELESKLGYENDVDQQVIDEWIQLGKFRTESLGGYRQEQWVAALQIQFYDLLHDFNIELPYPDASENAYW
jgi:hypothetical protein